MVRLIYFILFLFTSFNLLSEELSSQEKLIFSFIDTDNNKSISIDEINKSIMIIFTLIDDNQDGSISDQEIIGLKILIESMS